MSYQLGVDLGTTYTAAAVFRDGAATICTLGDRNPAIPSVVLLRADGTILIGDAAERRAMSEPERVVREFKRRLGDTTPIIVGGAPYTAEALTAKLLESVVEAVVAREGGHPSRIVVTYPANWGSYKRDLLTQAVRLAGLDPDTVGFLTEPEAAAISYAAQERIDPGEVVAVYDLGGGTFDAAVLRRTPEGFSIIGRPEGIERLGGIDFDAAVFRHVTSGLGTALSELDANDPTALAAVARLRQDCVLAKEALSADADAAIPVLLPTRQTEVRITRHEFESLIRGDLMDTIDAMRRAIASAGIEANDVARVLLVGGSSRIPLVSQLVGAELRPPSVDAHPKHAIALGAAFTASGIMDELSEAPVPTPDTPVPSGFNPKMTVVAPHHLYRRGALESLDLDTPSVRSRPLPIEGQTAPGRTAAPPPSQRQPAISRSDGPPSGRTGLPVEGAPRRSGLPIEGEGRTAPSRPAKAEPIQPRQAPPQGRAAPPDPTAPPERSIGHGPIGRPVPPEPPRSGRTPIVEDETPTAVNRAVGGHNRPPTGRGGQTPVDPLVTRPPGAATSASTGGGFPWLLLVLVVAALVVAGVLIVAVTQ